MTDIITMQEGVGRLEELERYAIHHFGISREAFDEAIMAIWEIRNDGLWLYATDPDGTMYQDYKKPRFKDDYLYHFGKRVGRSVSSIYEHLGTIDSWQALGLPMDELYEVGVKRARPVQILAPIDGRTGELRLPSPEVLDTLPGDPGDDPIERVRMKVEETLIHPPEPLAPSDVRKAFRVDTRIEPDVSIWETLEDGLWAQWGPMWDGRIISEPTWTHMPPGLREYVLVKLHAQEYGNRSYENEREADE